MIANTKTYKSLHAGISVCPLGDGERYKKRNEKVKLVNLV